MTCRLSSIFLGIIAALYGSYGTSAIAAEHVATHVLTKTHKVTSSNISKTSHVLNASEKLPADITVAGSMAGMTEYQLKNGLKLVLVPDSSKPVTTVNITYQVGSRNEHYGETGMAHLLEHLLFKGTPTIRNLPQELSSRGMRPNGTTWYDRTNYFETFAASDEKLEWALKMEADRMINAFIARKDLDSEMTVVRNEMESGENNPQRILVQKMTAAAYQWHNYGKETIGARSDVENVAIDNLHAFYTRYYQPDNAVLVVAGSFDQAKVLNWVNHYFGAIAKPTRTLPMTYTQEPAQDGERAVYLHRVGSEQDIGLLYHIPATTHPDFPALEVLAEILSNSPSGRLYHSLIDTKKATEVSADVYPLKEPGFMIFSAELREEGSLDEVQKQLITDIENAKQQPFTDEELIRAKRSLTNSWNQIVRDPQKLGVALSQAIAVGDWRVFLLNHDRLSQVTLKDVQRVAETYLRPVNRTLGIFKPTQAPERVAIPSAAPIQKQLEQFKPLTTIASGELFNPSFENIEKRTSRFRFKNGAQLAVLPKKNRGETVALFAQIHWGDENNLKSKRLLGELLAPMLMRGTQRLNHQQLVETLEKLDAQLSLDSDVDGMTVKIETTKPNLDKVVELLNEILKTPRFETKEWEVLKQQTIAGLESSQTEPSSWATRQLESYQQPYKVDDPRYHASLAEDTEYLKQVQLTDVQAFYNALFSTQHSEWAVVGEADVQTIKNQLETAFGMMQTTMTYKHLTFSMFHPEADTLIKQIPDKANALLQGRHLLTLQDTDPDYPALVAANALLGGGFLNSRLATRIRQKEGISYGVGSYLRVSSDQPYTEWRIYALFAPQNRERLLKVFKEELIAIQKDPVNPQHLHQAIEGWLESRRLLRSQDAVLAASLSEWMRLGRTGYDIQKLEEKVKNLKPQAVQEVLKKYVQPEEWVYSIAGTFPNVDKVPVDAKKPEDTIKQ